MKQLETLTVQIRAALASAATALLQAGGLFKAAKEIIANDKNFAMWVDTHFGSSFRHWVEKLMLLHEKFRDQTINLELIRPDVLLALSDMPQATVQELAKTGSVSIRGEKKGLGDVTLTDIHRLKADLKSVAANNAMLKESLQQKDLAIEELEKTSAELAQRLQRATSDDEKVKLQQEIERLQGEIKELKSGKETRSQQRKCVAHFESTVQGVLGSEALLLLEQYAQQLPRSQKERVLDCIQLVEDSMKKIKERFVI